MQIVGCAGSPNDASTVFRSDGVAYPQAKAVASLCFRALKWLKETGTHGVRDAATVISDGETDGVVEGSHANDQEAAVLERLAGVADQVR